MPLVSTAAGDHLDLRAAGLIKVTRLAKRADFEFLNGLDRRRHHARGHRAGLITGETGKVLDVSDGIAGHVIRVVTAIYRESVLVHETAGDIAARCHARLETQQGCGVAAEIWQQLELLEVDGVSNRGISRL